MTRRDSNLGPIAHWKLEEDGRDALAGGHDLVNHGVTFDRDGAVFSGRSAYLESQTVPVAAKDFAVSAWINTDQAPDDALGDIVSRYDPVTRAGFNLSVLNLAGVTSAHSNYRTLHFGIHDPAAGTLKWVDCGRPGDTVFVCALAVFDGALYAAVYSSAPDGVGRVFRYAGGQFWEDCGSPDPCNCIGSLAVHGGNLYAGAARYRAQGSALPPSSNESPGGKVYRYAGGKEWVECGALGDADTAWAMTVYDGRLYAIPIYHQGMWRYEGGRHWRYCGTPGVRLMALGVYDGRLFGAGNEGAKRGGVYVYEGGETWRCCGGQPGVDQVYSFAVYQGRLYVGTWPEAAVFRYDGDESWAECGRLGEEQEVMAMAVYNGTLYAGTLPLAQVYQYEGADAWSLAGRLDWTPDVKYRRAWSMAVFQGRLFCGTLPSGRVYALEAGANVTYDRALEAGWRHVTAQRRSGELELYVDGERVAGQDGHGTAESCAIPDAPFRIGFGAHDYFNGRIRDVRVYNRALGDAEILKLCDRERNWL